MAPPPQDVQIHFQLPAQDERWVAYDTRGVMLCALPCRKRVERGATVWLRADGDASAGIPLELAGSTTDEITATPRGGADTTVPWIVLGAGLLGAGVAAAVMAGTEGQAQTGASDEQAAAGVYGGLSAVAILVGGIWLLAAPGPRVDVTAGATSSTLRLGMGHVAQDGSHATMRWQSIGLSGSF